MKALLLAGVATVGFHSVASAAFIYDFEQIGQNVVASGSGTLNVNGLGGKASAQANSGLDPSFPYIALGASTNGTASVDRYTLNSPFTSFGSSIASDATFSTGDFVGSSALYNFVVPVDYVSGSILSNSSTFSGHTLASLGLTQGTYTYSFGSGANVDTFTIQVGSATALVPEPASLALLCLALVGVGACKRRPMAG